jgi:hypothetical protein
MAQERIEGVQLMLADPAKALNVLIKALASYDESSRPFWNESTYKAYSTMCAARERGELKLALKAGYVLLEELGELDPDTREDIVLSMNQAKSIITRIKTSIQFILSTGILLSLLIQQLGGVSRGA